MKPNEVNHKKVFTAKGFFLGEVEGIEIDENWKITVDVSLNDEAEKLFDLKSGIRSKSIMPIPASLMGPIGPDRIALAKVVEDPKELVAKVRKK